MEQVVLFRLVRNIKVDLEKNFLSATYSAEAGNHSSVGRPRPYPLMPKTHQFNASVTL